PPALSTTLFPYTTLFRSVVGPDGTLYVFWDGSTRLASLGSTYMVKSTDGGATWSPPLSVSTLADVIPVHNTAFRVNSYPAAAAEDRKSTRLNSSHDQISY